MTNKKSIFSNIDATLKTVEIALKDLRNELPERRNASIRNIITFGRSVTFAIQKLKSHVDGFDEWYKPKQQEMISNPLFKYFKDVRDEIIHEGKLKLTLTVQVSFYNPLFLMYMPKPPNHKELFIGDENGGSGWIVENADGEKEKYYITMNKNFINTQLFFEGLPDLPYEDTSILNLCTIYFDYLKSLVNEAQIRFL